MSQEKLPLPGFDEMNLSPSVFSVLESVDYKIPTPIQAMTIPHLVKGKDVLGQARTGTGKTAAFALPLLSKIDLDNKRPQILVLTPTRELAIQVAESFKTYGSKMRGLNVLPVYGGQSYGVQLNQLKRGVHVVVGTPGRLMDHMRRKTITLADLSCIVLDEADEMLHMGFIDDVEWILDRTPDDAQTALFSATMPGQIRRIAQKYLTTPEEIIVQPDGNELSTINQKFWMATGAKKSQALIKILEAASFDGVIVFVKTKNATLEVAKSLENRGFKAEALNGDLAQAARERTVNRLKNSHIDILVATDVAARGLDVDRISHVINYDMPSKVDPYVHRIGRTGRAGRTGEAILFVNRNERWMLKTLERATKQKIQEINLPSNKMINEKRVTDFQNTITQTLESDDLSVFQEMIEKYADEKEISMNQIAAALAKMTHGDNPFFLPLHEDRKSARISSNQPERTQSNRNRSERSRPERNRSERSRPDRKQSDRKRPDRKDFSQNKRVDNNNSKEQIIPKKDKVSVQDKMRILPVEKGMERYRIEVGRNQGIKAGNIVGAITNEAGLDSKHIGKIDINQEFSLVDLPFGMPTDVFTLLKKTRINSHQMEISKCA